MRKKLAAFLIPTAIVGVLLYDFSNAPFYNEGELRHVTSNAVQVAKQGNLDDALERFDALKQVAPESVVVWRDYLVVLAWANQHGKVISELQSLPIAVDLLPAYTQRSLLESALREKQFSQANQFAELYIDKSADKKQALIDVSNLFLVESQPLPVLNLLSSYQMMDSADQALLLRQVSAELQLGNTTHLDTLDALTVYAESHEEERTILARSLVNASRLSLNDRYLQTLSQFYETNQSEYFAGDYLTLLVWHGNYAEAVSVYDKHDKGLPSYALKAAVLALAQVGRTDDADRLYTSLPKLDFSQDEKFLYFNALVQHNALDRANEYLKLEESDQFKSLRFALLSKNQRYEELLDYLVIELKILPEDSDLSWQWFNSFQKIDGNKQLKYLDGVGLLSANVQDEVIRHLIKMNALNDAHKVAVSTNKEQVFSLILAQIAGDMRQRNDYRQALSLYRYLSRLPVNSVEGQLGVALTLRDSGDVSTAVVEIDKTLRDNPHNHSVIDTAIDIYRSNGFHQKLLPLLEKTWLKTRDQRYLRTWVGVVRSGNPYAELDSQTKAIAALANKYPDNQYLVAQKLMAKTAAGHCVDDKEIPLDVLSVVELEQLAFALRRCNDLEYAFQLYQQGANKYPDNAVFTAGLILVAVDKQDFYQADLIYNKSTLAVRNHHDVQLARAWQLSQQKQYTDAAALYGDIVHQYPASKEAYVGQVINLTKSGQAEDAWRLAESKAAWFSVDEVAQLQADRVAWSLRHAAELMGQARVAMLNRVMQQINIYEDFLKNQKPNDREKWNALQWDKQLAYHLAGDHHKVLTNFEQMSLAYSEVPVYALLTLADSQAALQKNHEAAVTLNKIVVREPGNFRALRSLYYVNLSLDNYDEAGRVLTQMQSFATDGAIDTQTGLVNWAWRQKALLAAYQNQLSESERMLNELHQQAPHDPYVRQDLALVKRWRGHPEAALTLYEANITQQESLVETQVGKAHALLDLNNRRAAETEIMKLTDLSDSQPQVKALQRRWAVHSMKEFDSRLMLGRSNGGENGSSELLMESWLFTSPEASVDEHSDVRFFAHHIYSAANFEKPERDGRLNRVGVGASVNNPQFNLQWDVEVSQSITSESDKGLSLRTRWRPDDYWTLGLNLQSYSLDVPLRAINVGLEGKSIEASAGYRLNESTAFNIATGVVSIDGGKPTTASGIEFDQDDNRRTYVSASLRQRLYTDAFHQVDVIPQYYQSRNNSQDVVYFSPDKDELIGLSMDYEGLIWRDQLWKFKQHVNVGVGHYSQWKYRPMSNTLVEGDEEINGHDFVWDWQYEHLWWWSDTVRFNYGVLNRRRSYDGEMETQKAIFGGINIRF